MRQVLVDLPVTGNKIYTSPCLMKLSKIYREKEREGAKKLHLIAYIPVWPHFTFHTTFQLCKICSTEPQSTVLTTWPTVPWELFPLVTFPSVQKGSNTKQSHTDTERERTGIMALKQISQITLQAERE